MNELFARRKMDIFAGQKALNKVTYGNSHGSASMEPRNHFANAQLKLDRFVPILRRVED